MRRSWAANCVGIGLAGGFIEPLESTSLHFTQMAIRLLVEFFPDRAVSPPLAKGYNRADTPFWSGVREDAVMPDRLAEDLEMWRYKLPDHHDVAGNSLFTGWSHIYVLSGKGYFDDLDLPLESAVTPEDFTAFLQVVHSARDELAKILPDHRADLEQIHS